MHILLAVQAENMQWRPGLSEKRDGRCTLYINLHPLALALLKPCFLLRTLETNVWNMDLANAVGSQSPYSCSSDARLSSTIFSSLRLLGYP